MSYDAMARMRDRHPVIWRRRSADLPSRCVGRLREDEPALGIRNGTEKPVRFRPDFIVDGEVVVEIKARSHLRQGHWAQLINCLEVSELEVGLLLNFGPRPEFKRLILSKEWK